DAAHLLPAVAARGRYYVHAVLAAIKSFNLPTAWLDAPVVKLLNHLRHQPGTQLQVVGMFVAMNTSELRLLRRYQKLEHEPAASAAVQVIRQPFQATRLALVQRLVGLRVVPH